MARDRRRRVEGEAEREQHAVAVVGAHLGGGAQPVVRVDEDGEPALLGGAPHRVLRRVVEGARPDDHAAHVAHRRQPLELRRARVARAVGDAERQHAEAVEPPRRRGARRLHVVVERGAELDRLAPVADKVEPRVCR